MGEVQELQLQIRVGEANKPNPPDQQVNITPQSTVPKLRNLNWWLRIGIYTVCVIVGQSAATLLGGLYYDKGGNSKWMATFVQIAGFPILLPLFFISTIKNPTTNGSSVTNQSSPSVITLIYVMLGLLVAADCMLFSVGLQCLPVSTFSLICATQLAFNAFFSYFLNSQKFTPFIVNSLVLLTMSSALLVSQTDSKNKSETGKRKYILGFLCTVGGSAGYALVLTLTQFSFQKVIKREDFRAILHMTVHPSLVATCAIVLGLFASGEWKHLNKERKDFELGELSYVMTLAWIAVGWQVYSIGATCLIVEVSSLFCNAISTFAFPIVPIFAAIIFHENLNGVKIVSMLLAIWGFVSYNYQHYLDSLKLKSESENVNQVSQAS
ncbi:probable purine permease 10 [Malania oleifera]|uniref:probable purine permease 10 n=1 Tax=Malania oleifera TaxID=397392 RepID=UPI0025AE1F2B|nr:probable purine permease 10 [Malania oleifera]